MALAAPSMVHRSGDSLVVRSVVSGDALYGTNDQLHVDIDAKSAAPDAPQPAPSPEEDGELPQCKIKRNYACAKCTYYTQNPRFYLYHLKNVHKEKIKIYECPSCLYASKHSQKLQRHVHMVHVMGAGRRKVATKPKQPIPIAPKLPNRSPRKKPVESDPEEESESDKLPDSEENNDEGDCESALMDGDADGDDGKHTKCSLCPFTSRSQTLVSRHERVVHLKKKFFRCMKCNYVTHMKARYTKHVKYHSMPMIKCEMCDFRTPYKWNLDRHNKNHTGDGAFKCSLCNFTADIKQSLTVHEMNHHVPPVGQSAPTAKRRNRVGASDSLLPNGQQESTTKETGCQDLNTDDSEHPLLPKSQIMIKKPKPFTNFSPKDIQGSLVENAVNPKDLLQSRNGNMFVKRLKCRICEFTSSWENEISRHESTLHGLPEKKKSPRPIPNLIPIQNKIPQPNNMNVKVFDKITSSKNENPMSEKDLNDIYAKSCSNNSALKDFASLIGDSDAFKTYESETFNSTVNSTSSLLSLEKKDNVRESCSSPIDFSKTPEAFKKKNASFFDKLKEKLMNGANESSNMVCNFCGYESKCLSESVRHQKLHLGKGNGGNQLNNGNSQFSGAELSSTRCQHCRQRCKTSSDLLVHLQSCSEANRKGSDHLAEETEDSQASEDRREFNGEFFRQDESVSSFDDAKSEPHPMENKVFVWNSLPERADNVKDDEHVMRKSPGRDAPLVGVETAPGYGAVTSKNKSGSQGHNIPVLSKEKNKSEHALKKVYKCPHCSFWASTASRFHVHIVGHLNKKPFECSLCAYRSNWRWDITKHIRLKTVRDVSHERARVLMTDETGRRNYSKYNKYLTLMRVQEPSAESSGSGRRTKSQTDSPEHSSCSTPPPPLSPAQFPAPPRLTPAPPPLRSIDDLPSPQQSPKASSHLQYSQPPPLQPYQSVKRSQDDKNPADEPPKKKSNPDNKKTMWKCKKCFFRDGDRAVVLAHVKEHYRNQHNQTKVDGQKEVRATENDTINNNQFNSGNMNCRLLPSILKRRESGGGESHYKSETGNSFKCPSCPFYADSHATLAEHIFSHDSVDDVFRCFLCTFHAEDKQKLIEHMAEHNFPAPGLDKTDPKLIASARKQPEA